MQTNLINSYIQMRNKYQQAFNSNSAEEIEIVTRRKSKPDFDINKELANRTFIKPFPPKGHIVKDGIMSAPAVFVDDLAYDMKALKAAWKGKANDHQLGKLNDLGMKLGGLGIAAYLFSIKKTPVKKGMEFVGLASFFSSMALWPLVLEIPARIIHGFNPFMRYEDSQGRKKPFFQDNQYLPYDLIPDKVINRVGDRTGIPRNMPNRRDAVQEKMRQIALQNNTMWMLTAGFGTPILSSLICYLLEPQVENIHGYFMNKKIDNILVDFASAQRKYRPKSIEKDVAGALEMYKGRAITPEILDKLSVALTQELNPKVTSGMKADLENLFLGNKYKISNLQIKPMKKSIEETLKKFVGTGGISADMLKKIVPTEAQLSGVLNNHDGKKYTIEEMKPITDSITELVEGNISELNSKGTSINKNTVKKIIKALYAENEVSGPMKSILTNSPANILDDQAQEIIKKIAAKMTTFCAENNALSMYSFKKIASAPDTSKGKFWNDVADALVKVLEITPEEIADTRYDRPMLAELISKKMQLIAADKVKYNNAMRKAAQKLGDIRRYVKPDDMKGKYITQLESTFNSMAGECRALGLNNTAFRLVGKNGNEAGSLLGASRMFVADNLSNIQNSFARFFNTMNFFRTVVNDPELSRMNETIYGQHGQVLSEIKPTRTHKTVLKEVKEEIVALCDFLSVSGRISDYSVKFEFLRNLTPNEKDTGAIGFNPDGTIKYKYYNKVNLAREGVFIPNDKYFFKRAMHLLYSGRLQHETEEVLKTDYPVVLQMLEDFRKGMIEKVGNIDNFAYPSKVVYDIWHKNNRVYTKATPNERSLAVGAALDDLIGNTAKRLYNTNKWLKIFLGFGAGLTGVTVLSQFCFGKGNKKKVKG